MKELDIVYFDTETTGLPPRGAKWKESPELFPNIVQLAWIRGNKEHSYIIKPDGWEISDESIAVHGITMERAISEGVPFESVIGEFIDDCLHADYIVAHNIWFDKSVVKAMCLRTFGDDYDKWLIDDALNADKRIDTMMKTIKFVGARYADGRPGKFPRLEELYAKLFNGETFPAHDALQDVKALVRCVPELIKLGIIELAPKEPEQMKMKFEACKRTQTKKQMLDENNF